MLPAGTLGGTTGLTLLVGCLVEAVPEVLADIEELSEPANGLISDAEADVRAGMSEPD